MSVESLKDTKQKIIEPKKMGLLVENPVYKPVSYTHLTLPTSG